MSQKPWRAARDPLYRGDASASGPVIPVPTAEQSIVRHILYLDGAGRESPYLSTSESVEVARRFAGRKGIVWQAMVASAESKKVSHLSRTELAHLLTGKGMGNAAWHSAYEVAQARRYVEEWLEHLFDFGKNKGMKPGEIASLVKEILESKGS